MLTLGSRQASRDRVVWSLPQPYVWQNVRSGLVSASGRSHGETSAAGTVRLPTALGSGVVAAGNGEVPLPDWVAFAAEDLIDLDDELRAAFRK